MAEMKLLTVSDVAKALGVSRYTVYNMIRRGQIPALKLGRRTIRIPENWLDQLLARNMPKGETQNP